MLSVIILSVVASFDDRKKFILNDPRGKLVPFLLSVNFTSFDKHASLLYYTNPQCFIVQGPDWSILQ